MAREKQPQEGSFGVIGLGRFGMTLVKELAQAGQDVLAIDKTESKIREVRAFTEAAFVTDTLDKETLTDCGVQNCDTVVVAIGERIDTSILTTLTVIQLGVRRVIAKAMSEEQGEVLKKLGAEVIYPESDMAVRLAKKLTTRRVLDFLALSDDIEISEIQLCGRIVGQTVATSNLRGKWGLNIIAIVRKGGEITSDITPDTVLREEDAVVVIGTKANIDKFEQSLPSN